MLSSPPFFHPPYPLTQPPSAQMLRPAAGAGAAVAIVITKAMQPRGGSDVMGNGAATMDGGITVKQMDNEVLN